MEEHGRLKETPIPSLDPDARMIYGETVYVDDPILPLIVLTPNTYQLWEAPELRDIPFNFNYEEMSKEQNEIFSQRVDEYLEPCYSFSDYIVMNSESINCRCVPKYNLDELQSLPKDSLYRCNLAIAVMALIER